MWKLEFDKKDLKLEKVLKWR